MEMHDRCRSHHETGDIFMMGTPGRNWLYIASPDALMDMFRRRSDFPQCIELTEMINVFGTNLGTVEGQQWKTQRKMIATCFNEKNYEIVWSESLSLARDMLKYWVKKPSINSSADDLRTLSLHVLAGAGFGKSFEFEGHDERSSTSLSGDYKTSLQMILENCILIMALGPKSLSKARPWLPKSWKLRRLADRCAYFQRYMTELYEDEKVQARLQTDSSASKTLMSSLVRASQDEAKNGAGLTESEIYGNMFMLNFAGHDTTAHTFTFAIHFLAANPAVQDWVSEEVRSILCDNQAEWDYATDFPRLKRCFAVLLETLRLYTPVPVAKWTAKGTASLETNGKTFIVPANTMVIPSYATVHTEPKYWGTDSLTWRPSRWIQAAGAPGKEELITPQKGTFLGWSEGAHDCPARKFSQVEFVAAVATLLRDWRVDPVPLDGGESLESARNRVLDLIKNDSGPVLLLQMLHPERASLTWTKSIRATERKQLMRS
ncbi:hypothetical protein J7T55_002046 [Diaporthe amygdali]|uniref:uncharacterized protein n=1 Tax=Phomopsis amygdali TaxID=1214568 RepID=UPI0022FEFDC7|nr:uncharacterized protein J7T55_002046 [Diaporthe amygdali]KAJ0108442.1 hypothetical protein J7T55_002046 [Diaporthe amygdali]